MVGSGSRAATWRGACGRWEVRAGLAVLVLVLVSGPPAWAWAQGTASVRGRVVDGAGQGVAYAQVFLVPGGWGTTADREGRFVLRGVPAGRHRLEIWQVGYAPEVRELVVGVGEDLVLEVALAATPLTLPGIQVTATPGARDPRAVVQATSQLAGRVLERELGGTIAQTLRYQPGIAVRSNGPAATLPIVRGLTGDRILVLQDGQRSSDLAGSAVDHAMTIDPLVAQRVEVVRGPATLLYGNNALGGVVNVISNDVPTTVAARSETLVAVQSESAYPGVSATARTSIPLGGPWALAARLGGRTTKDMRIGNDPELGGVLPNTQMRNGHGALGAGYARGAFSGGLALRVYDFAYGLPHPPGADPVSLRGNRLEAAGRVEALVGFPLFPALRLDATGQAYGHEELNANDVVQQVFKLRTQTVNLLVRQGAWGPLAEGAWGVSGLFKQYSATGPAALTPAADSRALGLFGFQELELAAGGPALQLGARYDRYGIRSHSSPKFGPGRHRVFRAFSGSVGVRVPLTGALSASASMARSFRAPTVEELFSGAAHAGTGAVEYGDPDLEAERGRALELVLHLRAARWSGELAVYHNRVNGYIQPELRGDTMIKGVELPVFVYAQNRATLRGLEGQLEFAATDRLALSITGDLLRAAQQDGTPLSFMPPARMGVLARWDNGTFSAGGHVHHEFRQDRVGAAGESPTPAHTLLRLYAGVRWTGAGMFHSFTLRAENLGDKLHREATSRIKDFAPGPGRNVALLYRLYF